MACSYDVGPGTPVGKPNSQPIPKLPNTDLQKLEKLKIQSGEQLERARDAKELEKLTDWAKKAWDTKLKESIETYEAKLDSIMETNNAATEKMKADVEQALEDARQKMKTKIEELDAKKEQELEDARQTMELDKLNKTLKEEERAKFEESIRNLWRGGA